MFLIISENALGYYRSHKLSHFLGLTTKKKKWDFESILCSGISKNVGIWKTIHAYRNFYFSFLAFKLGYVGKYDFFPPILLCLKCYRVHRWNEEPLKPLWFLFFPFICKWSPHKSENTKGVKTTLTMMDVILQHPESCLALDSSAELFLCLVSRKPVPLHTPQYLGLPALL